MLLFWPSTISTMPLHNQRIVHHRRWSYPSDQRVRRSVIGTGIIGLRDENALHLPESTNFVWDAKDDLE